jgi:hypothetical protein
MAKLINLKTRNRYDYNLNILKLYTGDIQELKDKLYDKVSTDFADALAYSIT